METNVENLSQLERRLTVSVPAERVEREFSDRLQRLSRKVKLPGFRPGKVPLKMVEAQYGGQVLREVAGELIQASLREALGQHDLQPAAGPNIEPRAVDRGRDLEYTATFEILPQVLRADLDGVRIERPVSEPGEEDVDRTLETMRDQRRTWQPVERAAAEGDRVVIDFEGILDGVAFEGGSASDYPLVLGSRTLLPDMERQLAGLAPGAEATLKVGFPADYRRAELAGKTVDFHVRMKEVAEPVLPALDADFARAFGIEDGDLARLRAEVRANLERELLERIEAMVHERVMQALVDLNPIETPRSLVEQEIDRMIENTRAALARHGASPDLAPGDRAAYENDARRRVILALVLSEIARREPVQPDAAHVRRLLERRAVSYENPQAYIDWHLADPRRLAQVESEAAQAMLVERLLAQADVADVPQPFGEIMYRGQEQSTA